MEYINTLNPFREHFDFKSMFIKSIKKTQYINKTTKYRMDNKKHHNAKSIMNNIDKIDELGMMIEKSKDALSDECRNALNDILIKEQTNLYNHFHAL